MNDRLQVSTGELRWTLGDGALAGTGPVLALGAYLKNRPCLVADGEVVFGDLIGDLDTPEACARVEAVAARLLADAVCTPRVIAHDLHPDFHSSRVAVMLAARLGVPAIGVQHHHAHVEAVLAEHGHAGPALGLALDGVGLGTDGTAWGGELLLARGADFVRVGHLRPLPLPGGDRAAREPWRMAAAVLAALGRGDEIATRFAAQPAAAMLDGLLSRPHLCPPTTSLGRCFDAAAGLLGVCEVMQVEAEAAIALERLAAAHGTMTADAADWRIEWGPLAAADPSHRSRACDEGDDGRRARDAEHDGQSDDISACETGHAAEGTGTGARLSGGAQAIRVEGEGAAVAVLDLLPLFARLLEAIEAGPGARSRAAADRGAGNEREVDAAAAHGAARFHATLVAALADWVGRAVEVSGVRTVVFSGGCFHNRILSHELGARLRTLGLDVLEARRLSPGDDGLALGQARVAAARLGRA